MFLIPEKTPCPPPTLCYTKGSKAGETHDLGEKMIQFTLSAPWQHLLQEQAAASPPETFTASLRGDKVSKEVFGTYVLSCCREAVKASFYNKDKTVPVHFGEGETCETVLYIPYFKCYARITLFRCFTNHLYALPTLVQHAAYCYLMKNAVPGKCCQTPFTP